MLGTIGRGLTTALAIALVASACATGAGIAPGTTPATDPSVTVPPPDGGESTAPATTSTAPTTTTTTEPPRDCTPVPLDPGAVATDDPVLAAIEIAATTFPCADEVTLTGVGDEAGDAAATYAVANGTPLLLAAPDGIGESLLTELDRLAPKRITVVGMGDVDLTPLGAFVFERLAEIPGPTGERSDVLSEAPPRLWIVDTEAGSAIQAARAAATATGDTLLVVGGDDLRDLRPAELAAVRSAGAVPTALIGPITENADWQLEAVRAGWEIPGGGLLMFPDRRLIALYGHPGVPVLGVLGEQGPEAGIERLQPILDEYDEDGVQTVPTFEIIATVADAAPGADGDYSAEITVDALRPWVDAAREAGAYVILDLQPGRTDFLTQAKYYEELLREPHVGLALDPEWRLQPDQFHLRQIGSVEAAEINTVVEWLAAIVREEALPQKLLVLHQFRVDMIRSRETVLLPPELAVLDHVDGQGALTLKYDTWGVLTTQTGSDELWWGWKNFYDEDPQLATPQQVLELDPTVYMVSFQ